MAQGLGTVRLNDIEGLPSVPLLFRDGAPGHLEIRGEAPGPGEVALPAGMAESLGIEPGEQIVVLGPNDRTRTLSVSGSYDTPSREDPFWFGSRNPFPAPDSTEPSPLLVDRATYLDTSFRLGMTNEYTWDAFLDLEGVAFDRASRVPGELRDVEETVRADPQLSTARLATGLGTLFDLVDLRVQNLRVPILLVVFQIGAVTLAVLAGVGAPALTRQTFELAVLHSRGFQRRTLLVVQAAQALLYAVVAYPLGLLLGMGLAKLAGRFNGEQLPGVSFPVRLNEGAAWLGIAVAVTGALVLLALSVPVVSRTVIEERKRASREDRPLLSRVPVELIVLPLGIFAFIQLRNGTKPQVGEGAIEPFVLAAPTLLLFAASFIALRLFAFVLRRLDGAIGRSRRLPTYLSGRRLGRSPGTGSAAALLLLLSMGLLVIATSYRAIVIRNHQDAAHVQIGADFRVNASPPEQVITAIGAMPPKTMAVVRTDPSFRESSFSLPPTALGIDPDRFEEAGWWREDFSTTPIEEILREIDTPPLGLPVPDTATELTMTLDGETAEGLTVQATSMASNGDIATSEEPLEAGSQAVSLPLPDAERLLSITFAADTTIRSVMDPAGTIAHWSEHDRGGHFPGLEVPELLTEDIRDFTRRMRMREDGLSVMRRLWRGEQVGAADLTPWPAAHGGPAVLIGSWKGERWIPRAAREFDGWIASGAKTSLHTLVDGIARYRAAGGKRAVVTNIAVDLTAPTTPLADDAPFHLCCAPAAASERLQRLRDLGFDDAVLLVKTPTEANLATARALLR